MPTDSIQATVSGKLIDCQVRDNGFRVAQILSDNHRTLTEVLIGSQCDVETREGQTVNWPVKVQISTKGNRPRLLVWLDDWRLEGAKPQNDHRGTALPNQPTATTAVKHA